MTKNENSINNMSLIIGNISDSAVEDTTAVYKDIEDGFIYNLQNVALKAKEFEKVLKEITEIFPDIVEYDFSRNKNNIYKKYVGENIRFYIQGNSIDYLGLFSTKSNDDSQKVWNIYTKHVESNNTDVHVYMYSYSLKGNQLIETSKEVYMEDLNYISKSYYPYIDTDIMFDQFFTGQENILLLAGKPGTGKSKILSLAMKRAASNPSTIPYDKLSAELADHQFITIVNVKGIDVLSVDEFWLKLESIQPDFVFIDDLDYMLTSRDAEITTQEDHNKNIFLDHFLTFTDGIEKNQTKFVITTNQPFKDIDSALLRKGRLFDILEFRSLNKEEAMVIWEENDLKAKDFNDAFTGDEILPADLG